MDAEYTIFVSYLLLGPLAWVLYAIGMYAGRRRLNLLDRPSPALADPAPRVSIIVPAKDEAGHIADCLRSALAQDYGNFEVIAIDDRSSDGTGRIMDELAAADPRLKVVHKTEPPAAGWTGKCHALQEAMKHATGQWLLFVDSDVILRPTVLSRSVTFAAGRGHEMLSLILNLDARSFWEELMMPVAAGFVFGLYAIALSNNDHHRRNAFANGQYILIRRDAYEKIGGHGSVRSHLSEDVALARLVKSAGYRPRVAWATDLAAVRMYASLSQIIRGWARNFFGCGRGRPGRILMGIAFLLCCCFSAYAALGWGVYRLSRPATEYGAWGWLAAAGTHLILMTGLLAKTYSWGGSRPRHALLLPLSGAVMIWIFIKALWLCATGKVQWRGDAVKPDFR